MNALHEDEILSTILSAMDKDDAQRNADEDAVIINAFKREITTKFKRKDQQRLDFNDFGGKEEHKKNVFYWKPVVYRMIDSNFFRECKNVYFTKELYQSFLVNRRLVKNRASASTSAKRKEEKNKERIQMLKRTLKETKEECTLLTDLLSEPVIQQTSGLTPDLSALET